MVFCLFIGTDHEKESVREIQIMAETVDVRGLSCPQPVLDTLAKIAEVGSGTIETLVDSEASEENITRGRAGQGVERDLGLRRG